MSTLDIAHFDPIEAMRQAKIGAMNLNELQKYLDDERDRQERAAYAERRAHFEKLLEDLEEKRQASTREDARRRVAAIPNNQVAEWLFAELGDEWPDFLQKMRSANLKTVVAAMNRIEDERASGAKLRGIAEAQVAHQEAKATAATVRRTQVERELALPGHFHV